MVKTVYLAGPMAGQRFDDFIEWQLSVASKLPPEIKPLGPARGDRPLEDGPMSMEWAGTWGDPRMILWKNMADVRQSDAVLVNLIGAKSVSRGTLLEMGAAYALNIPIITVMEPGNVHEHPNVKAAGPVFKTVDEGVDALICLLSYGV